jgi:hypothetical protein
VYNNACLCPLVHRYTLPANAAPSACAVPFCIDLTPGLFDHILRLTRQHAEAFKRGVEGGTHYPLTACLRIAGGAPSYHGHLQPVRFCTTPTSCPFACTVFREGSRHIRTQANSTPVQKLCPAGGSWFVSQAVLCIPSCTPCVPCVPVHPLQSSVCV